MTPRARKWVVLSVLGAASGTLTLWLFQSFSLAAGAAPVAVLAVIVVKHLALAALAWSPYAAFKAFVPKLRQLCPFRP